jgi:hypothetical protein
MSVGQTGVSTTMSGRSLRIFNADSHHCLICCSKWAIRSHNRPYLASFSVVLQRTVTRQMERNDVHKSNEPFVIFEKHSNGDWHQQVDQDQYENYTADEGQHGRIGLKYETRQRRTDRTVRRLNERPFDTHMKMNVVMPTITNGSYLCFHSSRLFNGKRT